jgi:amino acid transporter
MLGHVAPSCEIAPTCPSGDLILVAVATADSEKGVAVSFLDRVLGKPLATSQEEEQKIGVMAGVPILGLDGLSSSAYGPEAALTVLIPLGSLGLLYIGPIIGAILVLLGILYFSYRQTITAYPTGGGSYTVAKENLGTSAGLLAGAALIVDYILNVAVGISAGVGALISAVPALHNYTLTICLVLLVLITLINLRGVRESGLAFGVPTYAFVGSLMIILVLGVLKAIASGGHPAPVVTPQPLPAGLETLSIWLLLRSFASGCTAMTGVEAVSNGVNCFAKPAVRNAHRTLTAIVLLLGVLLAGIAYLLKAYGIGAMDQQQIGYQSVISQIVAAVAGRGAFYYVTIASVLAVLALSANTSFAGFPRLCRQIAEDGFLPRAFASIGRRLVHSFGIMILAILSGLLLIAFRGITDRLIPLFAVGAFAAFTLSQAGMVSHWKRIGGGRSRASMIVNGVGAVATAIALIVIMLAKFVEGAWITLLLIPFLVFIFYRVRRHYGYVAAKIGGPGRLDLTHNAPPVVVVPIAGLNAISQKALRFALRLSPNVIAVHIHQIEENDDLFLRQWADCIEGATRAAGLPVPELKIVPSPYRQLVKPLMAQIDDLKLRFPERLIAVIIPELVEAHWYEYLLHNQRAKWLKANLFARRDHRVVTINIPWYMD